MSNLKQNLPASIHQRLLNKAHETGRAFNELIQYYALERFLYRLSVSKYAEQFTLKGALMFNAWGLANTRPTRDIDLLGHAPNQIEQIVNIVRDICKLDVARDGLEFDADEIQGEHIKEDAEYEGIRVSLMARLGNTRLPIQIDIGFADVITPEPERVEYPTILDFPAPHLFGYPPETVVAEKFQAMTVLGMANSRMKDFYDIWTLANHFKFDGAMLQRAIERTFQNRNTELPDESSVIFSNEFVNQKAEQWISFGRKIRGKESIEMAQVVQLLREFLIPVIRASKQAILFKKTWTGNWD
ncbi:MAG: nucleotidyl transferase AbiEii/AbiGii toxin family protein [Anaerolineales bacterium]